ncbi:DUF551 domain-containing protein [Escherichia coli]|nr:DUF551 domain-containing protein [Escherichia coli]ELM8158485.1 DUF551 domain-containing protein [Escherichia coli]
MTTITREQLRERAREKVKSLEFAVTQTAFSENRAELEEELELARIALASLEAEPVGTFRKGPCGYSPSFHEDAMPLYTAPPAPVSVPAAMEIDDDFDSAFEHGKAVGWNAYRAAMLQGADRPQNEPQNIPENIPATQFKPVADLYGLTSPTGGETSFTFDAVEARDFIDGGWSCQEYVELERFQEAVSGNPPVIPDSWTKCSERMPEKDGKYLVASSFGIVTAWFDPAWSNKFQDCDTNCDEGMEDFEGKVFRVTHWQSLPAAPKQGDE